MTSRRTYEEGCPAAHAMDLIGERWALLIVRELMYRPKRFNELRSALPRMSPNVLSQRLRDLTERRVIEQRQIHPNRELHSYELTPWGRQLELLLLNLARWGAQSADIKWDGSTTPDGLIMNMRAFFDAEAAATFSVNMILWLDTHEYSIEINNATIQVSAQPMLRPEVLVRTTTETMVAMLCRTISPQQALLANRALVAGDIDKLQQFVNVFHLPVRQPETCNSNQPPATPGTAADFQPVDAGIVAD